MKYVLAILIGLMSFQVHAENYTLTSPEIDAVIKRAVRGPIGKTFHFSGGTITMIDEGTINGTNIPCKVYDVDTRDMDNQPMKLRGAICLDPDSGNWVSVPY